MANNLSAWFMWYLLIAVLSGSLIGCEQQKIAYTGNASVEYLTDQQMKAACPDRAMACSYVFSNGQCFIYIHENYKNNASWDYALKTHEYAHCTGSIPVTQ